MKKPHLNFRGKHPVELLFKSRVAYATLRFAITPSPKSFCSRRLPTHTCEWALS